jgi:hypothetical protein
LESFENPQLPPSFAELDKAAKEDARKLHTAQSVWGLYQVFIQKQAPELLRILRYRDTLSCQIISLIGSTFDEGEPYTQSLLAQLTGSEIWRAATKSNFSQYLDVPCPITYSDQELAKQEEELAKWGKGIERKARVVQEVGAYTGWDGAVSSEDYNIYAKRLENAKANFLYAESKTPRKRLAIQRWTRVNTSFVEITQQSGVNLYIMIAKSVSYVLFELILMPHRYSFTLCAPTLAVLTARLLAEQPKHYHSPSLVHHPRLAYLAWIEVEQAASDMTSQPRAPIPSRQAGKCRKPASG